MFCVRTFICDSTAAVSSLLPVTIEKQPTRCPYNPALSPSQRFDSGSYCNQICQACNHTEDVHANCMYAARMHTHILSIALACSKLMTVLQKNADGFCIARTVTTRKTLQERYHSHTQPGCSYTSKGLIGATQLNGHFEPLEPQKMGRIRVE